MSSCDETPPGEFVPSLLEWDAVFSVENPRSLVRYPGAGVTASQGPCQSGHASDSWIPSDMLESNSTRFLPLGVGECSLCILPHEVRHLSLELHNASSCCFQELGVIVSEPSPCLHL